MKWLKDFFRVWRRECWLVFTDVGVMLFFFALPLGYPIVYTLIYNPEVVKEIDTVIVDHSRTAESRELARTLDATQSIHITGYAADMAEARRAWAEKDCYAIIEIPSDYARQIGSGGQGVISYYQDMSLLLRYRQILLSLTSVQMHEAQTITAKRVATMGGGLATSRLGTAGQHPGQLDRRQLAGIRLVHHPRHRHPDTPAGYAHGHNDAGGNPA